MSTVTNRTPPSMLEYATVSAHHTVQWFDNCIKSILFCCIHISVFHNGCDHQSLFSFVICLCKTNRRLVSLEWPPALRICEGILIMDTWHSATLSWSYILVQGSVSLIIKAQCQHISRWPIVTDHMANILVFFHCIRQLAWGY